MRVRLKSPVSSQPDTLKVTVIHIENPTKLITLDDPEDGVQEAVGAFVRLQPPEGLTADQTTSWRDAATLVAKAVKVLPAPRSAEVPEDAKRVDDEEQVYGIREEAEILAAMTEKPDVIALVGRILDEVGI